MEAEEGKVVVSIRDFDRLYGSLTSLKVARGAIEHCRDKDGGLRLPPKCVDMLLHIMEVEG